MIQEQFIDFFNDGSAKHVFREMSRSDFLIVMAQAYPDVAKMALKVLTPFVATNESEDESEAAFSTLLAIKIKSRNRLEVTNDMRVALANTKPNLEFFSGNAYASIPFNVRVHSIYIYIYIVCCTFMIKVVIF